MIQPTITFGTSPMPVLLDSVSIKYDVVLLDTFFHILIFHKELVAQWRNQGYQDKKWYEELLEVLVVDVRGILIDRFPVPRYVVCDQGKSQARFLLSKLNHDIAEAAIKVDGGAKNVHRALVIGLLGKSLSLFNPFR